MKPSFAAILSLLFALLFAGAAWVQRNDPDPEIWMAIYGGGAILSAFNAFGLLPRGLAALGAFGFLGAAGWLGWKFHQTGQDWNPENQFLAEEVREAGGVAVIGLWCLVMTCMPRKKSKKKGSKKK